MILPASDAAWSRDWPAPAKLNLFLHVVGRRADGYHLLQTVFRLVELADTLRFVPREDGRVEMAVPLPGVPSDKDLCVRAARLLQQETGVAAGVTIHLDKRIPMGGGLGGGSSDAATVMLALNHLWNTGLSRQRLQALGAGLGADVPFFLFGNNALGEGVGEALTALELPPAWYVILMPPVQVPTAAVFAAPELTRNTKTVTISSFSEAFGHNDLEPVVCARYPEVARHLEWLGRRGKSRMSGSGACVFAPYGSRGEAEAVLAGLPADMRGVVAKGLDRHPLQLQGSGRSEV